MSLAQIPTRRLLVLFETAARFEGLLDARSAGADGTGVSFRPADPIGNMACDAWLIDEHLAVVTMSAYMEGLRRESDRLGLAAPRFSTVLRGMRQAISSDAYPAVDADQLLARLNEVPAFYGGDI